MKSLSFHPSRRNLEKKSYLGEYWSHRPGKGSIRISEMTTIGSQPKNNTFIWQIKKSKICVSHPSRPVFFLKNFSRPIVMIFSGLSNKPLCSFVRFLELEMYGDPLLDHRATELLPAKQNHGNFACETYLYLDKCCYLWSMSKFT